jgi:Tol biopolymer transport system component
MEVPSLGGQERTIIETSSRNDNLRPVWAPDGRHLVYSGRLDHAITRNRLLMVSRDSGAVWPLTSAPSGIGDFLPTFSPDGNRVAFMRDGGYFTLRIAGSGPKGEPQPVTVPGGFQ